MDKIERGEYVISKNRLILGQVIEIKSNTELIIKTLLQKGFRFEIPIAINNIQKHSKNKIELLKDGDFVELEYKSPKYRKRITRVFEVSELDEYIIFENYHCNFFCKKGDKKITDKTCKNIKMKSILTHEQFESMKYNFEEG